MRTDLIALLVLLAASTAGAWFSAQRVVDAAAAPDAAEAVASIIDATGHVVLCKDYQRIVCGSSIAANVVPHLINSNRVVMATKWFADNHHDAFRLDHVPTINSLHGVESIIAANPDLVIVHSLNHKQERITRLRETGIPVLDLGKMIGWDSLRHDIRKLGQVVCQPERGDRLLRQLQRRLQQAAIHVPESQRKTAMWLAVYGGKLSGGSVGSSYHDLLRFAGLRDIVAGTVNDGWPGFSTEQVLAYDPDVIVTGGGMSAGGMAASIRALPGLRDLRAVRANQIISMPADTDSTGTGLVEAAEFLCDAVYGPPPAVEAAPLPE